MKFWHWVFHDNKDQKHGGWKYIQLLSGLLYPNLYNKKIWLMIIIWNLAFLLRLTFCGLQEEGNKNPISGSAELFLAPTTPQLLTFIRIEDYGSSWVYWYQVSRACQFSGNIFVNNEDEIDFWWEPRNKLPYHFIMG